MNKILKFLKDKIIYIAFIVVALGIIFISNSLKSTTSSTSAKYISYADATDTARVAKWNISKTGVSQGETLDLTAIFGKQLKSDTTGKWFLEVKNASEVTAQIVKNQSYIKMRLDNKTFDSSSSASITWDDLSDEFLLKFKIEVYYSTYDDLVTGYRDLVYGTIITKEDYEEIPSYYKDEFVEVLNSSLTPIEIYETTTAQAFTKETAMENGALVYYYENTNPINIDDMTNTLLNMESVSNDSAVTFVLSWEVGTLGGLDPNDENAEFSIYTVHYDANDVPDGFLTNDHVSYFDYTTYLSSIGGQATFEFDSDIVGNTYTVFYEHLTTPQRTQILGYKDDYDNRDASYHDYDKYCQYLLLVEYEKYLVEQQEVFDSQKYAGLKCSFNFNIHVEQVD